MVSLQEGWDNKNEDNPTKFSPKWTYNFINFGELYGVLWYATYKVLEKHGAATWEEFPYVGRTVTLKTTGSGVLIQKYGKMQCTIE